MAFQVCYKGNMTPKQAVREYGGVRLMAFALNVTRQSIHGWLKKRKMPYAWQCVVEKQTGGRLQARNGGKP